MKDRPRSSYKRTAIVLGAGLLIILTLSVAGKLLNPSPQQGETITIEKPEPEIIEPEPVDPQIHQAANCQRDSQAAYLTLEEAMTSANSELRIGRAQDWIAYAREQCRQLGSRCGSDRSKSGETMDLIKDKHLTHPALDYYGEEFTPWLLPPRSRLDNIVFDPRFIEWHGKRWLEKFKKQDIHAAKADFRSSLLNKPDRILIRWQEYEAANKHYAGTVLTQSSKNPIGIREEEKQHILRYQSALMANTVEELPPDAEIAPHIAQALLNPISNPSLNPSQSALSKPQRHPIVQEAINRGEIKLVRHYYRGAFVNGVKSPNQWWNTEEDWLATITK